MIYRPDENGIRDAKEEVDEAKRQIEIAAIEKEIGLLEDKKDLLNEQIDLLDEQADKINKFYDSQIQSLETQKESIEKYFESVVTALENSKSKYQELTEIVDKAELSAKLKQLGIDEEALLNGSEEEFQKLKDAYMGIVFQLNEGNTEVLSSLRELSGYEGKTPAVLSDTTEKLDEMNTQLNDSTDNMDKLSGSATTASASTGEIATNMGELNTSTEGLSDNLNGINDALTGIPEAGKIDNLATSFSNLGDAIKGVADALGIGGDEAVDGLVSALQEISALSLDGVSGGEKGSDSTGGGIISQFQTLKSAVEDVTNAISGGSSSSGSKGGDASGSSSPSMSAGAIADYCNVGDVRTIHLNEMGEWKAGTKIDCDGETHAAQDVEVVILDFEHDDLATSINGHTKAAISVQLKNVLAEKGMIDYDFYNYYYANKLAYTKSWNNCARRNWINSIFKNALPASIQKNVKQVIKQNKVMTAQYDSGWTGTNNTSNTTEDYCWLPSVAEVNAYSTSIYGGEGTAYQYYKLSGSNVNKTDSIGSTCNWWLRTTNLAYENCWWELMSSTSLNSGTPNVSSGISPGFCL